MFAGGIHMKIHFGYQGAVVAMARRIESEAAEVQSAVLSEGRIVPGGVLIYHLLHGGVHANVQWIHSRHFGGRERLRRPIRQLELEETLTQRIRGHRTGLRDAARVRALFVVDEIEDAVTHDPAAY